MADLQHRVAELEQALQAANAQTEANEMSYTLSIKRYQQDEERWSTERSQLQDRLGRCEAELQQRSQVQEELARVAQELRGKQRALDELQGALHAANEQRNHSTKALESLRTVLVAKDEETATLAKQKTELTDLVHQLQMSLSSNDSKLQFDMLQTQYDQERKYWESKIKILEEELNAKNDLLLEDRRRVSTEHLALRQRVAELKYGSERAEESRKQLEVQLRDLEGFLRDARKQANDLEQEKIDSEEHWRRQITEYQHLTAQHDAARVAAEGEATALREQLAHLKGQLQILQSLSEEASNKLDALQSSSESAEQRHKAQVQKLHAIISAAMSTGDVTVLANAIPPGSPQATAAAAAAMAARRGGFMAEGNVTGNAALDFITPGVPVATGNAAAARESAATAVGELVLQGKSVMEVWIMYQEMQDAWHQERAEGRRLSTYLEAIAADLEAKVAFSERQEEEASKMREALDGATATVAGLEDNNRRLQTSLSVSQASLERKESELRAQAQTIRDLSQQVKTLVEEVQRLTGKPIARSGSLGGGGAASNSGGLTAEQLLNAADVISHRLVTFRTLDELVEQNRRLLALVRQLGGESERSRAEVVEDVARQYATREEGFRADSADLNRLVAHLTEAANRSTIRIYELTARASELEAALAAAKAEARSGAGNGGRGVTPASPGGTPAPPGDVTDGSAAAAATAAAAELAQVQEALNQTRQEAKSLADTMQAQVMELREKLAMATAESARQAARAEDWQKRCASLETLRESEMAMRNALSLEKAQLAALLSTVQHKSDEAQQAVAELQAQFRARTEHQLVTEARMSAQTTAMEETRAAFAMAEAERNRALADAKVAEQLLANAEAAAVVRERALERRAATLESDLARLREDHERQQTLFHHSIEAATAQLREVRETANDVRQARDEAERSLAESRGQVAELRGRVVELQAQVTDLNSQLTAARGGGGDTATVDLVEGHKLRDAEAQLREVQADLASVREQLEARNAALETVRGAMATLQVNYDALRASHEATQAAATQQAMEAEAERAEAEAALAAADSAIAETRTALAVLQAEHEALQASSAAEVARLSAEVTRLGRDLSDRASQHTRADEDIARLQAAMREYRKRYEDVVKSHAADLKELQVAETRAEAAQATANQLQNELTAAQKGFDERQAAAEREKEALHAELAAAEARVAEHVAANEQLLGSLRGVLAGTHHELVGMSAEQYKSLMDYLGRDKALAAAQLELLTSERNKLREERDGAVRQAAVLRAQMASLLDSLMTSRADLQARINMLEEEDHARRVAQGQLRGELDAARTETERLRMQLVEAEQRAATGEAGMRESVASLAGLRAQLEAHKRGESLWREKYDALMSRYGKVTLEEHKTVKAELAGVRDELTAALQQAKGLQESVTLLQQQLGELRTAKEAGDADLEKSRKEFSELRSRHVALSRKYREMTANNEAVNKELAAAREATVAANEKVTALEASAKSKDDAAAAQAEVTAKLKALNKQLLERTRTTQAEKTAVDSELQVARTSIETLNKAVEEEKRLHIIDNKTATTRMLDLERQLKTQRDSLAATEAKNRDLTERIERAKARGKVVVSTSAAGATSGPTALPPTAAPTLPTVPTPAAVTPALPVPSVAATSVPTARVLASLATTAPPPAASSAFARGTRRTPIQFPIPTLAQQPATQQPAAQQPAVQQTAAQQQAAQQTATQQPAAPRPTTAEATVPAAATSGSAALDIPPAATSMEPQVAKLGIAAAAAPVGAAKDAPLAVASEPTAQPVPAQAPAANTHAAGGGVDVDLVMGEVGEQPAAASESAQSPPTQLPISPLPPHLANVVKAAPSAAEADAAVTNAATTGKALAATADIEEEASPAAQDVQPPPQAGASTADTDMTNAEEGEVLAEAPDTVGAPPSAAAATPTEAPASEAAPVPELEPEAQAVTIQTLQMEAQEGTGGDGAAAAAAIEKPQEEGNGGGHTGGQPEEVVEDGFEDGEVGGREQAEVVEEEGAADGAAAEVDMGGEAEVAAAAVADDGGGNADAAIGVEQEAQDVPDDGEQPQEDQDRVPSEAGADEEQEEAPEEGELPTAMEAPAVTEDVPADGEEVEEDGEGDVLSSEAAEDGEGEGKEDGAASPAMEVVAAQEGDAEGADKETTEAIAAINSAVDAVGAVAVAAARDAPVDAAEGVAVATVSEGGTPAVHPDTDVQLDMTEGVEGGGGDVDSEDGGMENDGDGDDGNRSEDGSDRGDDEQEADDDEQDGSARSSDMGNDDNDDDEDPDLAALRLQALAALTSTRKRQLTPLTEEAGGTGAGGMGSPEPEGVSQGAAASGGAGRGEDNGIPAAKRHRISSHTSLATIVAAADPSDGGGDDAIAGDMDEGADAEDSDLELDELVPSVAADLDARDQAAAAAAGAGAGGTSSLGSGPVLSAVPSQDAAAAGDSVGLCRSPSPAAREAAGKQVLQPGGEETAAQAVRSPLVSATTARSGRGARGDAGRGRGAAKRTYQLEGTSAPPSPSPEPSSGAIMAEGTAGTPSGTPGDGIAGTCAAALTGSSNSSGPQQKRQRSEINFNLAPKVPVGQSPEGGATGGPTALGATIAVAPVPAAAAAISVARTVARPVAGIRRAALGRGTGGTSPATPGSGLGSPTSAGLVAGSTGAVATGGMPPGTGVTAAQLQQQIAVLQQQQQLTVTTSGQTQGQQQLQPGTGMPGRGGPRAGRRAMGRGRGRGAPS